MTFVAACLRKFSVCTHNVKVALVWSVFETGSASVRSGAVLSAYIYLCTNRNSTVGYVQGITGIAQMLAALPAGWLADKYRRDYVLKGAAALGTVAAATLAVALLYDLPVQALFAACALLGVYTGLNNAPLEALFADCIPRGKSSLYTTKAVVNSMASGLGPLVSVVLFALLGNRWEVHTCRYVLLAGLVMMVIPLIVMCFFNDDAKLNHQQATEQASLLNSNTCSAEQTLLPDDQQPGQTKNSLVPATDPLASGPRSLLTPRHLPVITIPILITTSDFIGALAAGMTIKFFALFFIQMCSMQPVYVSLLAVFTPLGVSSAALLGQALSKRIGRLQVNLVTRLFDMALLCGMAWLPAGSDYHREVLVVLHLSRTAFANCGRPLMKSLMMDNVPSCHRGKFNALDSVRTFSWSGSAAAGGILIERYGYPNTFFITAGLKLVAYLPLIPLLAYVDDGVFRIRQKREAAESDLHEPLLP
ncbi:hypothetical protein ABBQ38_011931 [Trebouxia sp. C0009 RCD-2024]